jgi:hypothetical protein
MSAAEKRLRLSGLPITHFHTPGADSVQVILWAVIRCEDVAIRKRENNRIFDLFIEMVIF